MVIAWAGGMENEELLFNGCKDEKNSRDGWMVVTVDQQYEYTEYCTLKMVKMVNFRCMLIQWKKLEKNECVKIVNLRW